MYTLYSYYRSSCSWRVRLALALKGLPHKLVQINLLNGDQRSEEYLQINPSGGVPALLVKETGVVICQSIAILEYLEELDNNVALLPSCPRKRALVRQLVQIIASDCQPLQNLHVLKHLQSVAPNDIKDDAEARSVWGKYYILRALNSYTKQIDNTGFSVGDSVTMADLCLIPQLYNARRFGINVEAEFPALNAIELNCNRVYPVAFTQAHPDNSQ